jgi:chemotaxis protein methyltransferase CheR
MSERAFPDHVGRFKALLGEQLGLSLEDTRLGELSEVLDARVACHGGDAEAYLEQLERSASPDEVSNIARQVTIGETYFFRHAQQFEALRAILIQRWRGQRAPRVLSAGCASGEEAYSLAMLLEEVCPERQPAVLAADVNPAVLERAREGRYSPWSLRETPAPSLARWFRQQGRDYQVDERIRRSVRFVQANLAHDEPELLAEASFDIIFCRNLLMYFTPENYRQAVRRLSRALAPDGYLFMGSAETLRGISHDFHLRHSHGAFYYQRKTPGELSQRPLSFEPVESSWNTPASAPNAPSWVDQISQAAARILALTGDPEIRARPADDGSKSRDVAPSRAPFDLSLALDLLHKEQFAEGLHRVRALPPDAAWDPEAMLLEAVLLASAGTFREAEACCERLLAIDELNAGAHYVLALCNASGGRSERAAHHDRVALYLDPGFAMPRLHLGLLLRRGGDRAAARVELRHARSLLEREDGARLLMFGGGFSRNALLALCVAELDKAGGGC